MAKAEDIKTSDGKIGGVMIYCPGCKTYHVFDDRWKFNGDYEKPTFSPSMLIKTNPKDHPHHCSKAPSRVCHSFVRNGKIEFLSDCSHEYAGQTIDLPEVE